MVNFDVPYTDRGGTLTGYPCPRCSFPMFCEWDIGDIKELVRATGDEVWREMMEKVERGQ